MRGLVGLYLAIGIALVAIGFLLLALYFRSIGGYRPLENFIVRQIVILLLVAGVASLSMRTRDSAGCTRCWRAPKSRPLAPTTTSSPSSTYFFDLRARNAGSTSGK